MKALIINWGGDSRMRELLLGASKSMTDLLNGKTALSHRLEML